MSTSLPKPHHARREFCLCRKAYREGREPKAVKVYTVAQESNYIIVQGIPALGLHNDLMREFLALGAVDEHRILDDYPAEEFTEVLLIKFAKLQSARLAKRKMDNLNYCGGLLHVFYAPEYESIDDTRRKLQERRRTIAWRLRLLFPDSNGHETQVSASVEVQVNDSKESSVATLNVNENEFLGETPYIQPSLLPPPPVAFPTQPLLLPSSHILYQNHQHPFILTNNSRTLPPTSYALSFSEVPPLQPLPVYHSVPQHARSHHSTPPPDISTLKLPLDSVLHHHPQIHHASKPHHTLIYRPPFRGTSAHNDPVHQGRPICPVFNRVPQSNQPRLPSAVETSKLNNVSNSRNLDAAEEDYLGSRVEFVPISAKFSSSSNWKPVVKSYTHTGQTPRFVPRQLVKRQTDAKNTAAQPIETKPDPVNEDLKKMALALGPMPQGPALPPEEEQKRQIFRSSETGDASFDETVSIIREKVSQTTSVAPPMKKLKPS